MRNISLSTATPRLQNDGLVALRKGNSNRTIGRMAHRTIRPVTYSGTGNVPRFIRSILPPNTPKKKLEAVLEAVYEYADKQNDGNIPTDYMIRNIAKGIK